MSKFTTLDEFINTIPYLRPAVVCYLVKGDQVLLGVRKTSSTNLGINIIAGIGGKREEEDNDDDTTTLLREVKQEINVELTEFIYAGQVKFYNVSNPRWNMDVAVYVASDWVGEPSASLEIEPKWFEKDNLPFDRMFSDNQHWVPKVLAGQKVKASFLYDENHLEIDRKVEFSPLDND